MLKGLFIIKVSWVYSAYMSIDRESLNLITIADFCQCYMLQWYVSTTMTTKCYAQILQEALGSQLIPEQFILVLLADNIQPLIDNKDWVINNFLWKDYGTR